MSSLTGHLDWIHLERLSFPCVLGLLDWEQKSTQTLAIAVSMGLDLDPAAAGDLERSVNYADTLQHVRFIAEHGRWRLLESMGSAIARLLLAPPSAGEHRAQVMKAVVHVGKPDVFDGRAMPSVELHRDQQWCALAPLQGRNPGATVEILQESRESGAYRVRLRKDGTWTAPAEISCLVICGRVQVGPRACEPGDILPAGAGDVRGLTEPESCLLAVGEVRLSASARGSEKA